MEYCMWRKKAWFRTVIESPTLNGSSMGMVSFGTVGNSELQERVRGKES